MNYHTLLLTTAYVWSAVETDNELAVSVGSAEGEGGLFETNESGVPTGFRPDLSS